MTEELQRCFRIVRLWF